MTIQTPTTSNNAPNPVMAATADGLADMSNMGITRNKARIPTRMLAQPYSFGSA